MHDTAIGGATARSPLAIVDQTVDQNTPVAGTIIKQYPCFVGLMPGITSGRRFDSVSGHHNPSQSIVIPHYFDFYSEP